MASAQEHNPSEPTDSARDRLIRSTVDLLAESGPEQLKVRTITDAAGVSTIAVYHHFGGLKELLQAVVAHGYADLAAAMKAASQADADPGVQLFAIALSTRSVAQSNAHLYDMMFGLSTRGTYRYVGSPENKPASGFATAYAVLVEACERLAQSGRVSVNDSSQIAAELWSAVHGFVTLEMAGHFAHFADPVSMVLRPMAVNHFVGMGDQRAQAESSADRAMLWWSQQ
ncbi:TetR/AcrR family transcriptional regulator [Williamsia muralis]|uniref:TetR/AcrR family transcriptional regulator n=1 Tax=Williamsia marianensis TaxID=85044 RepID=A0ABU4ERG1_WILMA|nr:MULTISPECIES: TetR/AcrR family transcriptional regulator [Williamsia]MDV7133840.1 TetR/AcrR family transcriptional regulator [Williamsia muralis]PVY30225.1 TetR family transcriptional regulator [Williamsia marianensis]